MNYIAFSNNSASIKKKGKCSKISNTFLLLFSNRMLVIKAGINEMFVRIANREDPDQTDVLILVWTVCLGIFIRFELNCVQNLRTSTML